MTPEPQHLPDLPGADAPSTSDARAFPKPAASEGSPPVGETVTLARETVPGARWMQPVSEAQEQNFREMDGYEVDTFVRVPAVRDSEADDVDSVGADLSRLEDEVLYIHDALVEAGLPGAVNSDSIIERVKQLAASRVQGADEEGT